MRSTQRLGTALLAAFVLSAQTVAAQSGTARIVGRVQSDAAAPLPNVGVGIVGTQLGARTGTDGRYVIANLAPGRYVVRAALIATRRSSTPSPSPPVKP
jgi:hypothetical protein